MKILLLANYLPSAEQSMQRFAALLEQSMREAGHEVRICRPPAIVGALRPGPNGLGKWLGYIDRLLLFPLLLRRYIRWADVVHICDHVSGVYCPFLQDKPHVVTCHDMLSVRSAMGMVPENPTRWSGRVYHDLIVSGLRKAQLLACVSDRTAEDVKALLGVPDQQVSVVPNALNYDFLPLHRHEAEAILQKAGVSLQTPYFFHVGGNQWYKNRVGVVKLFAALRALPRFAGFRLVMAGRPLSDEVRHWVHTLGLDDAVVELTDVGEQVLHSLYCCAEGLLFPSLQEGFGWPVSEAQACGCWVVTSNREPMVSVSGGAAVLIDPEAPDEAAKKIEAAWQDREACVQAGLLNARRFSRSAMAAGYLSLYRRALGGRPAAEAAQQAGH